LFKSFRPPTPACEGPAPWAAHIVLVQGWQTNHSVQEDNKQFGRVNLIAPPLGGRWAACRRKPGGIGGGPVWGCGLSNEEVEWEVKMSENMARPQANGQKKNAKGRILTLPPWWQASLPAVEPGFQPGG